MNKERRALIAEHDFTSRWTIQRLLEPYTCCDVATCGKEALLAFHLAYEEGIPYDIVLLDNVLQGLYLKINDTFGLGRIGNLHHKCRTAPGPDAIGNVPFAIQFLVIAVYSI